MPDLPSPPPLVRVDTGPGQMVIRITLQPVRRAVGPALLGAAGTALVAGVVTQLLRMPDPWRTVAGSLLLTVQLGLFVMPLLYLVLRRQLQAQLVTELRLEPHRLSWRDQTGVHRRQLSVHEITDLRRGEDLFGDRLEVCVGETVHLLRTDDPEQLRWLQTALTAWRQRQEREHDETSRREAERLGALQGPLRG